MQTVLLTGDAASIAEDVGSRLGVDVVHAGLLPNQKLAKVRELLGGRAPHGNGGRRNQRRTSTCSGGCRQRDGLGDRRGAGVADIVLLANDLLKLVEALRIARWCRSIIWQNFAGTLVVDGLGIVLASLSFLNPLLAAFIHVSSELLFILNSTRLLPSRRR